MADVTEIAWCDSTFNPWIGCTKVGPGCDNCYAEADFDLRKHRAKWGPGNPRSRTSAANWKKPLQWNAQPFSECMKCGWRGELREAEVVKNPPGFHPPVDTASLCPGCRRPMLKSTRRRVFCASLGDVFDNEVPAEWRRDLFDLIELTPNLDWLLLTKRIGNVPRKVSEVKSHDWLAGQRNVWLGATICNQAEADRDIPKLLAVPARVRFLSIEPLLGPINLAHAVGCKRCGGRGTVFFGDQEQECDATTNSGQHADSLGELLADLHWVVAGGESGHQARPMHPDWVRVLRDQCEAAGVPFLFKQWGEWAPYDRSRTNGAALENQNSLDEPAQRVGKKAAGRLLDGVLHHAFPEARP